jgi:hypothetical protein
VIYRGERLLMAQIACTLEHIKTQYGATMQAALIDPTKAIQCFSEFFTFAYQNYENMAPEARAFLDERERAAVGLLTHINHQIPDGIEKRSMQRKIAKTKGKHLEASRLISNFSVLRDSKPLIDEGPLVFLNALQRLCDFMHDICIEKHAGSSSFARINLLYWVIDELTVANFLVRRGYLSQTYPHLRSVMEILDKVELFGVMPNMAEVWIAGGDEHTIWKKLSPPRVRELLKRDNKDPIYSHFSESGAHSTYTAAQRQITRKDNSGGTLKVGIGVGGKCDPVEQASLIGWCIMFTNLCTMHASQAFATDLNTTAPLL